MNRNNILTMAALAFGVCVLPAAAHGQTVVGTYDLAEVGGKALPAVMEVEGDCREEVVSAVLTLNSNNTWKLERTERDVCGTKVDEEKESDDGRYKVSGNNIELLDSDGKSQADEAGDDLDDFNTGTVQNNTITVKLGKTATVATFRKR